MEGRELAKLMDRILDEVLIKDYESEKLFKTLGEPVASHEHFLEVIDKMDAISPKSFEVREIATLDKRYLFSTTAFAQDFKENGGFIAEYDKETESARKMNLASLRASKIEEMSERELEQKIRNNKWAIPISIASILIATCGLLWSIFKPSDNNLTNELQKKIERLEYNQQQLEKGLENENKALKEKLYEAEMMIDIYESDSLKIG